MQLAALVFLGGCVIAALVLLRIYRHIASPLRGIPGPFLARFTDAWYIWKLRQGKFEVVNQDLHDKYGPIVRYGPNRYSFNTLDASKAIYGHGTQFPKSSWYSTWTVPGEWSLFSDRTISRHAANRRLYQATYSMSALVSYEPYVDECADLLNTRLSEMAAAPAEPEQQQQQLQYQYGTGGVSVNMGHWMQCYAFDVIGCITYSKRLGFLDQGLDIGGIMSALEDSLAYATLTGVYWRLHPFLTRVKNYLSRSSRGAGRSYVLSYTKERMEDHRAAAKVFSVGPEENDAGSDGDDDLVESTGKTTDFLTKFLARHSRDAEKFTTFHVMAGCAMNMLAGSDTTSITLSAIMYHLLKNPTCFQKLRNEIDALGTGKKYITFKESQDMAYLQAVIKEALRMHPATGLPLERVVPPGGATIGERFFPEGTTVGVNSWVAHRNPVVFGIDNSNEFRPERWLESDEKRLALMNKNWMPFGLGSRTCIGRHISHLEISKLIPRLVRDFDFELSGEIAKPGVKWETCNYWFVKPKDFYVKIRLRQ